MICIKCGLDIEKPKETCPRCGNILPRIEIERDEITDLSYRSSFFSPIYNIAQFYLKYKNFML